MAELTPDDDDEAPMSDPEMESVKAALDELHAAHSVGVGIGQSKVLDQAERIRWFAKDQHERFTLWIELFTEDLKAHGVSSQAIKDAEEWADYVLSK